MYQEGMGEEVDSWPGEGLVLGGLLVVSESDALGRLARPVGVVEMNQPSLVLWSNSSSDESEDRSSVRREIGGAAGPAPWVGSLGAGSLGGVGGN